MHQRHLGSRRNRPWPDDRSAGQGARCVRLTGRVVEDLRRFYSDPGQYLTLLLTSLALSYGGGAVMFWFHCLHRGEKGPAIAPWAHWLLDSSLGFVGLTPALAMLLPLAGRRTTGVDLLDRPGRSALVIGPLFSLVTAPGPAVHNLLVGQNTALANLATRLVGLDPHRGPYLPGHLSGRPHSALAECLLQVFVGLPLYTCLTFLALTSIALVPRRRPTPATPRSSHVEVATPTQPPDLQRLPFLIEPGSTRTAETGTRVPSQRAAANTNRTTAVVVNLPASLVPTGPHPGPPRRPQPVLPRRLEASTQRPVDKCRPAAQGCEPALLAAISTPPRGP